MGSCVLDGIFDECACVTCGELCCLEGGELVFIFRVGCAVFGIPLGLSETTNSERSFWPAALGRLAVVLVSKWDCFVDGSQRLALGCIYIYMYRQECTVNVPCS